MTIDLSQLGKRFNRHWIFRKLNATMHAGQAYAVTGPNGSGKSTLLQVLAGATEKSEGEIVFTLNGQNIIAEHHFRQVSVCAPYLELIEELTLLEFLEFHARFKSWLPGITADIIIKKLGLEAAANKAIQLFSSGMKQRVKLAQAFFTDAPVLLLDEPTSNLDIKGIDLYHRLVAECSDGRILIVASNDEQEISFCNHRIDIMDFKHEKTFV